MPRLKCVGGACDGQTVVVTNKFRIGDSVRVNLQKEFDTTITFDFDELREAMIENFKIYIIDCLKYSHGKSDVSEILFLRPDNFTTFDAIQFQFNKV
jgi:4-hydroxy-3-methylbut-2-en-1-yl diphosphate synthase IspG/GcpE